MRGLLLVTPRARLRRLRARITGDRGSVLAGQRVLVTGASSGIGAATARAVAARGATTLLVARREPQLAAVAAEISAAGGVARTYVCDLTDGAAVDLLVERLDSEHGGVDMVVNNAGRSIRRSITLSYDRFHDFERTMAVNYLGPVRLVLGVLPRMVEQRHGHVVNVLSWGVQVKAPKFAAYLASKTALDVFGRIAGRELYADGITFTNLRLPLVRTAMIGPTDAYRRSRALTPEQAAARVVRALEDRPVTMNTVVGNLSEVLNLAFPRLSDAVSHHAARRYPDSPAAARTSRTS